MLYPVVMTLPDGSTLGRVKVFGSTEGTRVYDAPDSLVVTSSSLPVRGRKARHFTLQLDDGGEASLVQGVCACGDHSPLRRWQPGPYGGHRVEVSAEEPADG